MRILFAIYLIALTVISLRAEEFPEASQGELSRYGLSVREHSYLAAARPDIARQLHLKPEVAERIGTLYRILVNSRLDAQQASCKARAEREQAPANGATRDDIQRARLEAAESSERRKRYDAEIPGDIRALLTANELTEIGKLIPPSPKEELLKTELTRILGVCYGPAGSWLAVSDPKQITLFEMPGFKRTRAIDLPARDDQAYLAYPPILSGEGKFITAILRKRDGSVAQVKTWDTDSGDERRSVNWPESPQQFNLRLALDSSTEKLAIFSQSGRGIYRASDGEPLQTPDGKIPASVLAFSSEGKLLAIGEHKGDVRVWSCDEKSTVATFTAFGPTKSNSTGLQASIRPLAFSHDGKLLAVPSSLPNVIKIFNLPAGSLHSVVPVAGDLVGCQFTHDDRLLIGVSHKTVAYWDVEKQQERAVHQRPHTVWKEGRLDAFALHPRGTDVVVVVKNGAGGKTELLKLSL